MSKKPVVLCLLAAVSAAGIGLFAYSSRESSAPAVDDIASVRRELQSMRREQEATRNLALLAANNAANSALVSRASSKASGETVQSSNSDPAPENKEENARAAPRALSIEEHRDSLERRFSAEAFDGSWSASARPQVTDFINKSLPAGSRVLGIDCRQTLCRAEIEHSSAEAHTSMMSALLEWDGASLVTIGSASGAVPSTLAFLAKPGVNLWQPGADLTQR